MSSSPSCETAGLTLLGCLVRVDTGTRHPGGSGKRLLLCKCSQINLEGQTWCRKVWKLGWGWAKTSCAPAPTWGWAREPRVGDALKAQVSKEVPAPAGVFRSRLALVLVGRPLRPVLRHPPTGSWHKRTLDVRRAAKVSAHLLPSCHDRWWLQLGDAAGGWHRPGAVVGKRRRRRRHQGKGLNTGSFSREILLLLSLD